MADKELLDRVAAAVEDAEATSDEELDWTRHRQPAKSPTAVYSVRIPVERIDELRELAAERGVAPTVLIRTWVLAQLDAACGPDDYAQRWERDMRATAEQLRKLLDERPAPNRQRCPKPVNRAAVDGKDMAPGGAGDGHRTRIASLEGCAWHCGQGR